jgi:chromosome segregation ATPase
LRGIARHRSYQSRQHVEAEVLVQVAVLRRQITELEERLQARTDELDSERCTVARLQASLADANANVAASRAAAGDEAMRAAAAEALTEDCQAELRSVQVEGERLLARMEAVESMLADREDDLQVLFSFSALAKVSRLCFVLGCISAHGCTL